MTETTTVKAEFIMVGENFPINEVTQVLQLEPSEAYNRGDFSKSMKQRLESCWSISTPYESSIDINIQLLKVIEKIKPKQNVLMYLKDQYSLQFMFMIVINIEDNDKPAVYLEVDTIHFSSAIGASINFDYFIYS